jgi:spore coat protein H
MLPRPCPRPVAVSALLVIAALSLCHRPGVRADDTAPSGPRDAGAEGGNPGIAVVEADADADIFADDRVLRLRIRLSPRDEERLRNEPRRYVRCVLEEEGGETLRSVAVKLKGAAGSFREFDDRPALTLNVGKFARGQSFHGLEKFHLNNSVQDESLALEWLAAGICRDAGVPAARTAHARVWINDRDLGVYVLKEGFDEAFVGRHFAAAHGNLYDGGFTQDIDGDLEKDCGDGPDDGSDLAGLVEACRESDPGRRREAIAARLDVDRFLSFMAVEMMLGHWDGYAQAANNYRLYFDPADGRAHFLVHGMDQILGDPAASILDMPSAIVARAVMEDPQWREAWRERVRELVPLFDPPEPLLARVATLGRRLEPVLREIDPEAAANHAERMGELAERIRGRADTLRAQAVAPEMEPAAFDDGGTMQLEGWEPQPESDDAMLERVASDPAAASEPGDDEAAPDSGAAYVIRCGASGRCIASWRRRVVLEPGDYVLRAVVTTRGVEPLEDEKGRGVGVRISGAGRVNTVEGTVERRKLFHAFTVEDDTREVELVAELRATAGEATFDATALTLHRLGP